MQQNNKQAAYVLKMTYKFDKSWSMVRTSIHPLMMNNVTLQHTTIYEPYYINHIYYNSYHYECHCNANGRTWTVELFGIKNLSDIYRWMLSNASDSGMDTVTQQPSASSLLFSFQISTGISTRGENLNAISLSL